MLADEKVRKGSQAHYILCVGRALAVCQAFEQNTIVPAHIQKNHEDGRDWSKNEKEVINFMLGKRLKAIQRCLKYFPDISAPELEKVFREAKESRNFIAHESCDRICRTISPRKPLNYECLPTFSMFERDYNVLRKHVDNISTANYMMAEFFFSNPDYVLNLCDDILTLSSEEYKDHVANWVFCDNLSYDMKSPVVTFI